MDYDQNHYRIERDPWNKGDMRSQIFSPLCHLVLVTVTGRTVHTILDHGKINSNLFGTLNNNNNNSNTHLTAIFHVNLG